MTSGMMSQPTPKSPISVVAVKARLLLTMARAPLGVLQILVEPRHRALEGIDLVLALRESMALVGVVMRIDDLALLLEDRHRLLRLLGRIANVVGALESEQRSLRILKVLDRRGVFVDLAVLHG